MLLPYRSCLGLLLWVVCLFTLAVVLTTVDPRVPPPAVRRALLIIGSLLGATLSMILVVTTHRRAGFSVPGAVLVLLITGLLAFAVGTLLFYIQRAQTSI